MIKPIIFSPFSVERIKANEKYETRRVVKGLVEVVHRFDGFDDEGCGLFVYGNGGPGWRANYVQLVKPRYQVGDILWVRETFVKLHCEYFYKADFDPCLTPLMDGHGEAWRSPMFMPKTAARLFLRVTDLRAERVADITVEGVKREGIELPDVCNKCMRRNGSCIPQKAVDVFCGIEGEVVDLYADVWNQLNAKRGYPFDSNPWAWVYAFEQIDKPKGFDKRWSQKTCP